MVDRRDYEHPAIALNDRVMITPIWADRAEGRVARFTFQNGPDVHQGLHRSDAAAWLRQVFPDWHGVGYYIDALADLAKGYAITQGWKP